jgi:integrase
MSRHATGQVLYHQGVTSVRVRIAPGAGGSPSFRLAVKGKEAADARAAVLADIARRLRGVASPLELRELLGIAGLARTPGDLAEAVKVADDIAAGTTSKVASAIAPTVTAFAADWTSGKLRKAHVDHVREKDHARDAQVFRDYINPVIGATRLPDVTLEHAERVMARLPRTLAPRSRKLVAQCLRKLLSFAVYPGRHLAINPIPREWMPVVPKSANKAKTLLWPAEDAKLAACALVPVERRLTYGILAREGMRASELAALKWRDLDLEHGRVRLDKNKTDDPRAWALSPDVVRVLAWWKEHTKGEAGDYVLAVELANAAWWLRGDDKWTEGRGRGDLRTAGITRAELHERTASRQPIRLHDLRATFVTVSLANGKEEKWVTDRTGHKSSEMVGLYDRQARTWAELDLGTLGALDALLPEYTEPAGERAPEGPRVPAAPPAAPENDYAAIPQQQRREWDSNPRMTVLQTVA